MIIVRGNSLEFNGKKYQCAVGKNGFSLNKKEGDKCSPIGEFGLVELFYRADKIAKPQTGLKCTAILEDDGWCDEPTSPDYNKKVKLPFAASHEKLWRDDDLYNIVIVIDYNLNPIVPYNGSAIFMHLARSQYEGTEGCVALKYDDLLEVLKGATAGTKISIQAS